MLLKDKQSYDAVVIGGGIVGASCILALARSGMRVAIVEKDCWGSGATAAGMGHLIILDGSEAEYALSSHSQTLWHALGPKLPAGAEFRSPGTLWVAADAEEMAEAERKFHYLTERGLPAKLLSTAELKAEEPELCDGLAGGLLVSRDSVVFPPVVVKALLEEAASLGATLKLGVACTHLGDGEAYLADGTVLSAAHLVNAGGAQASSCMPGLPVKPRKGHLAITDRYPGFLHHQVVELGYMKSAKQLTAESVACNVQPRATGQILIGSSRQFGQEGTEIDHALLGKMLRRGIHYLPGLAKLQVIRTWTGFRASTPDKLPLIGPDPRDPSLWLATGHEGLGITTSLATAELLDCALSGRAPAIDPAPYLPARLLEPTPSKTHKETL
jgi:glycine/D-amino acid oxidase-like deaminating enzyme